MTLVIILCLALIVFALAGYPLLMACLARLRPLPVAETGGSPPEGVSVVLCVTNAAARIEARIRNLLACEHPGEIEILVNCDGSDDGTAAKARSLNEPRVAVLECTERRGKAAGLNAVIPKCRFPLVVLCDARQEFAPDAITRLLSPFADPEVAAVSGLLDISSSEAGGGQGVDLYWRIERKLREWESRFDSVIGCTGAICAVRRDLYEPLPDDTILDDVVIPMRLVATGRRVIYAPEARAFDPQRLEPDLEKKRKLRTLVGNYQMIERYPGWLLPWGNRLWWQLISHKYLRLAVPWLLVVVAALSLIAPPGAFIVALKWAQAACYSLAAAGLIFRGAKSKLLAIPAGFVLLQWSAMRALTAFLAHRHDLLALWREAGKPSPSASTP